ncbi:MAG: filamentous hemagglutinin N-terminal domain-containing protein, partial [Candidatus Omnitrophica bacterium]|nr:filamentous hemagglutinin N-terminal domain-containing protein [Candidatus Omnitrophota bacterium]
MVKISLIIVLWCLIISVSNICSGLPEVEEIVFGDVRFTYPNASTLQIDATHKAIINYKSFDIDEDEMVIINLPSHQGELLNRVKGNSFSEILGKLSSNGILFLVNSNGIHFGSKSEIDVGGLIASTRDITDNNFINSRYIFEKIERDGVDRVLWNEGKINIRGGGLGVFIGGAIDNSGLIRCPVGIVTLVGGDMVSFNVSGDGLISVAIDKPTSSNILDYEGKPVTDQISNRGSIEADGGEVILKAEAILDIFKNAMNLDGCIKADRVDEKDGIVRLVSSGDIKVIGEISASKVIIGERADVVPEGVEVEGKEGIRADILEVCGKRIEIVSLATLTEVYRGEGIEFIYSEVKGDEVKLEGEDIRIRYIKTNNLILSTDNSIRANEMVIIQANQLKLIGKEFGSADVPLNIEANLLHIERIEGDIEIMESKGLGSSIMLRGPPMGFGGVLYSRDSELILEAERVSFIGVSPLYIYGDVTFYNFTAKERGKEFYFEANKYYKFRGDTYIKGVSGYDGLIKLLSSREGEFWYGDFTESDSIDISYVAIRDGYNLSGFIKVKPSTNWGNCVGWDTDPVWDGGGLTNNWSEPANWDTDTVPTSFDVVTFNTTSHKPSIVDISFGGEITSLIISGYTGTITLMRSLSVSSNYTQSSGTFNANWYNVTLGSYSQSGGIFRAGIGLVDINGEFSLVSGIFYQDEAEISIYGDFNIYEGGIFNKATGLKSLTFDGTGLIRDLTANKQDLGNVIIGGIGTIRSLGSKVLMSNLEIGGGCQFIGAYDVMVMGGSVIGDGEINLSGGEFLLDGSGDFGGDSEWIFYNLTFGDGVGESTTHKIGSNKITCLGSFIININHRLEAGSGVWNISWQEGSAYLQDISQIVCGGYHTVALSRDGSRVYAWGNNYYGQLGDGTATNRTTPVLVKGLGGVGYLGDGINGGPISQIVAGYYHTIALKSDGSRVYAWGRNDAGQLGDGTTTNRTTPVLVKGLGGVGYLGDGINGGPISQISAGGAHTIALKSDGSRVYAWGYNYYGQLGDGTNNDSWLPVLVKGLGGVGYLGDGINGGPISQISAGGYHTIALKSDGSRVYAWGNNSSGQLGDGTNN